MRHGRRLPMRWLQPALCRTLKLEGVDGGSMTPSQLAQISGIEVHKFAHPEMGCVSTDRMH